MQNELEILFTRKKNEEIWSLGEGKEKIKKPMKKSYKLHKYLSCCYYVSRKIQQSE
jgi:hypothetical protein